MRTLIYKRTHPGDPDAGGRFGIHDCMGQVRSWEYDAVVGVGGLGAEPSFYRLDGKINWIGVGPRKHERSNGRGPLVTFDRFVLFEQAGPSFVALAPRLAHRMYRHNVRVLLDKINAQEAREVRRILALAAKARPSSLGPYEAKSNHVTHQSDSGCRCHVCRGERPGRDRSQGC